MVGNAEHSFRQKFLTIVDLFFIVAAVFLTSLYRGLWEGYPVGDDNFEHLTIARFVLNHWPHSNWLYVWAAGMPFHLWYAPLLHYLVAFLAKITGLSLEIILGSVAFVAYALSCVSLYGTVLEATNNRQAGLLSASLAMASEMFWYNWHGATYSRVLATMFFSLTIWVTVRYARGVAQGLSTKRVKLLLFLSGAATISSHVLMLVMIPIAVTLIVFSYVDGWVKKITTAIRSIVPMFLISGFFVIPFVVNSPASQYHIASPPPPLYGYWDMLAGYRGSSPFVFLIILGSIAVLLANRAPLKSKYLTRSILGFGSVSMVVLSLASFLFLAYFAGYYDLLILPFPPIVYILFLYLSLFLSLMSGSLIATVIDSARVRSRQLARAIRYTPAILMVIVLITNYVVVVSTVNPRNLYQPIEYWASIRQHIRPIHAEELYGTDTVTNILRGNQNETMYRIGINSAGIAIWFNYVYNVPQTRDHEWLTIVYRDWRFWFDYTVWTKTENYEETNYALDWYAVKWFLVNPVENVLTKQIEWNYQKFLTRPEYYKLGFVSDDVYGFIFQNATTLVSPTNTPCVLVIGSKTVYNDIFRGLAFSNWNSQRAILLRGEESVDKYTLDELRRFNVILLYGYEYGDREKTWNLLRQYVEEGGGVIIDTGYSPDANSSFIPDPSPIDRTFETFVNTNWEFKHIITEITDGIDFGAFSAARYDGNPWKISGSRDMSVRPWARTVLWSAGIPVLVMGAFGKGRVVWSGLNLPYHIASFMNSAESLFLSKIINWVSHSKYSPVSKADFKVERLNPEKVKVTLLTQFDGVLFKESFFPNWKAYLLVENATPQYLPIIRAGPDFMYVRIPNLTEFPVSIVFEYLKVAVEYLGYAVTLATLLVVSVGLFPEPLSEKISRPKHYFLKKWKRIAKRLNEWWYAES